MPGCALLMSHRRVMVRMAALAAGWPGPARPRLRRPASYWC